MFDNDMQTCELRGDDNMKLTIGKKQIVFQSKDGSIAIFKANLIPYFSSLKQFIYGTDNAGTLTCLKIEYEECIEYHGFLTPDT